MKVLLIEDDQKIASFVIKGLQEVGYLVEHAENGTDGLHMALYEKYDAMVIDVVLPGMDGFTIVENIRADSIETPIIILSSKSSASDRIKGLQKGADDYLVKPFVFAELVTRIQTIMRRSSKTTLSSVLTVGDLSMNLQSRAVKREGKMIKLSPREFKILEFLMRNVGNVVSRNMIMDRALGYDVAPRTDIVPDHIYRLREKMDKGFDQKMLHTVHGVGYVLKEAD